MTHRVGGCCRARNRSERFQEQRVQGIETAAVRRPSGADVLPRLLDRLRRATRGGGSAA